jgi:hypothetical protein
MINFSCSSRTTNLFLHDFLKKTKLDYLYTIIISSQQKKQQFSYQILCSFQPIDLHCQGGIFIYIINSKSLQIRRLTNSAHTKNPWEWDQTLSKNKIHNHNVNIVMNSIVFRNHNNIYALKKESFIASL